VNIGAISLIICKISGINNMSFSSLGLCKAIVENVTKQGYTSPTDIQARAIPAVLQQQDVVAIAHTGTGKTASFTLPIIALLSNDISKTVLASGQVRALIIAPTRELAAQVLANIETYQQHINLRSVAVYGGVRIEPQLDALAQGVDILVATPGRLIDLYNRQAVNFDALQILVLDEADRMLDLGFIDDIKHIQTCLPKKRQTLMFSATFSKAIKTLAQTMLHQPLFIDVATGHNPTKNIKQQLYVVDKARKHEMLIYLLKQNNWQQVLVFCKTKRGADNLVAELAQVSVKAESIHANRTQHARTIALDGFREGSLKVLVATDIAARGIDIDDLPCVINVDLPYVAADYVHRIGRTGRAGAQGVAISLFSEDELKPLIAIERLTGKTFKRETLKGFALTSSSKVKDDDEYGNFEAHQVTKPRRRSLSDRPAKRRRK
jgi:ATP-dependent RNA helicase RhlE